MVRKNEGRKSEGGKLSLYMYDFRRKRRQKKTKKVEEKVAVKKRIQRT